MLLKRLWHDRRGFVATTDLILIITIVVLGTIVGLATVRDSVVQEFGDLATAIGRLNQTYRYTGNRWDDPAPNSAAFAEVFGSDYNDEPDFCEEEDVQGQAPAGIDVSEAPINEGAGL